MGVLADGATAPAAQRLGEELERGTQKRCARRLPGHVERGGTPTSLDRVLATRFGLPPPSRRTKASTADGRLRGKEIELVPLEKAVATLKTVPRRRMAETGAFTG